MQPLPHSPQPIRRARPAAMMAIAAPVLLLASCASPGPPRPPSLHLPAVVTDMKAERVGDRVMLHWTTPTRTTDNLPVPAQMTAEICREVNPAWATPTSTPGAKPSTKECKAVVRVAVKSGPSEGADLLPPELTQDPVQPLGYRIRVLNPEGRSADASKVVIVPSGAAPATVAGLRITATRDGALAQWQKVDAPVIVELERSLAEPAAQKTPAPQKPKEKKSPVSLAQDEPDEVRLRTADPKTAPAAADPGGMLDRSARRGVKYIYRAQRLRVVTLDGKMYKLHSELSPAITINLADTFAPAAPTGLASVPSTSNGKAAIDLSWQPGTETDLAGYNIYRRNAAGGFERLNPAPVTGPAYTDADVTAGSSYTYRVSAVDASGNESPASSQVTETAQAPNR